MSQAELLHEAGYVDDRALRASIRQLVQTGWLRIRKKGPGGCVYQPLDPHLALREVERDRIESYLKPLWPKGEALLKVMLNVLVDDPHYEDNARPGYLVNPLTGKHLEVDREYSRAQVLIEFNGPQHYRVTKRFSNPKKIAEQRQRDLTKAALAAEHGYAMVIILAPNLTFPALQSDLAGLLPLRKLHFEDPVVKFLDTYSRRHANRAGRGEFTEE